MKQTKGFAQIAILVVIGVLVVGGIAYVVAKNPRDVANNTDTTPPPAGTLPPPAGSDNNAATSKTLSDVMIKNAYNNVNDVQKAARTLDLNKVVRGDLNGDSYEDAFVTVNGSGAAGNADYVWINQKNGTAKAFAVILTDINTGRGGSDGITGITIVNGILVVNFDRGIDGPITKLTYRYRLVNDNLVRVN